MCFAKHDLHVMGIKMEGEATSLYLERRATRDGKEYEKYFTLERPLRGGESALIRMIPFDEVADILYIRPSDEDVCTICFVLKNGDSTLSDLKVNKMCFNTNVLKKMIRLCKEANAQRS